MGDVVQNIHSEHTETLPSGDLLVPLTAFVLPAHDLLKSLFYLSFPSRSGCGAADKTSSPGRESVLLKRSPLITDRKSACPDGQDDP